MGQSLQTADCWDEVWDAYEARQRDSAPAILATPSPPAGTRRSGPGRRGPARRGLTLLLAALLALPLLGGALLAGPVRPLLAMAGLLLQPDAGQLLGSLALPPGLQVAPPATPSIEGAEARRYLAMISGELAAGWQDPAALQRVVAARQSPDPALRDATLAPLAPRLVQLLGPAALRLELAPKGGAKGPGLGLGLDLAWREGAWHVTRLAWPG